MLASYSSLTQIGKQAASQNAASQKTLSGNNWPLYVSSMHDRSFITWEKGERKWSEPPHAQ